MKKLLLLIVLLVSCQQFEKGTIEDKYQEIDSLTGTKKYFFTVSGVTITGDTVYQTIPVVEKQYNTQEVGDIFEHN